MNILINPSEYNPYYKAYLDKVQYQDIVAGLTENGQLTECFLNDISEEKFDYAYAEGKWTIKELIQHVIDTERVFSYRALRFARKDTTELSGFDQDVFAMNSQANLRSKPDIINDYSAQRQATIALFQSFTPSMMTYLGKASGSPMSVRALGYIIIGHENHHLEVIKDRYL